jgi:malonyl-CoA decarboxylase
MIFDSLKRSKPSQPTNRDSAVRSLVQACHELLSEEGEASGTTRAKETLAQYAALDAAQRVGFFQALKTDFSPNPEKVLEAAYAYAHEPSSINLAVLSHAAEPPRQELLRRLNRAPGGTHAIVGMRVKLLDALRKDAELTQVDDDFRHLLSSWFNPGFLELRRVDWNAPATLLEQVIQHEAVHEVRDWNDLRRRLQQDRRCFAFFHPAISSEPLIFVEVALLPAMAAEIGPLIDTHAAPGDAASYQTAVFYSISNCEPGLRGVSLGNFLIKRVAEHRFGDAGLVVVAEDEVEAHAVGDFIQRIAFDDFGAHFGEKTFVAVRVFFEEVFGHDGTQNRVAEVFQAFVVLHRKSFVARVAG